MQPSNNLEITKRGIIKILSLGDSYTIGEGVSAKDRWPNQLAGLLTYHNYHIEEIRIVAQTGWTTGELIRATQNEIIEHNYDLVTLLIGVNNQYRGLPTSLYKVEFSNLLSVARLCANNNPEHVLILSIPDWSITPFAVGRDLNKISHEIDELNRINRISTKKARSHYLDITTISRNSRFDSSLLGPDNLHPSAKLYEIWAREALNLIVKNIIS